MEIQTVKIEKPEAINFILGQSHFIKTVEDIHEALVSSVPGIKFGLAFCEASGKCLIRWTGTDETMVELAKQNAQAIGAGHSNLNTWRWPFVLFRASLGHLSIVRPHLCKELSPGGHSHRPPGFPIQR